MRTTRMRRKWMGLGSLLLAGFAVEAAMSRGRSETWGETSDLSELTQVRTATLGTALVFGAFQPENDMEKVPLDESLSRLRSRIVRLGPVGRPPVLLHDGEGTVVDVAVPSERVLVALVRQIKPPERRAGKGGDDVERLFRVLRSEDAGATWKPFPVPAAESLSYVEFSDEKHGWITGYGTGFLTNDGGATWAPLKDPPRGELQKNVMAFGRDGGALVFNHSHVELRDRDLRVVKALDLGAETRVTGFGRADDSRLLVFFQKGAQGAPRKRAGALEVRLPGLERGPEIPGLPPDLLVEQSAGGRGRVLVTGARTGSASFLGISHQAYLLRAGGARFTKLPFASGLYAAAVALDPVSGAILAQATGWGPSRKVEARRVRESGFLGLW